MSDCKICFQKGDGKVMRRPAGGACSACDPETPINPADDACICPPLGEPRERRGEKDNYIDFMVWCW